jgi:hypothetical protein
MCNFFSRIKDFACWINSCPHAIQSESHYFSLLHLYFENNAAGVRVMVFNSTFNNISVISWRSVLLVEEARVSGENHRPAASH